MAELITFPASDLAGTWEQSNPLGVTAGSYVAPTVVLTSYAAYHGADSAASATQTGALHCGATTASRTLVLITSATDETTSTALGAGHEPTLPACSASWTLRSVIAGGSTTTLKFQGDETTDLGGHATASDIQTALEALPSIGSGNVVCTGGPLGGSTLVTVTFAGSLANTYISDTIINEFEDYVVTKTSSGGTVKTFTFRQSINIPRGAGNQPQLHVWTLAAAAGDELRAIDFEVASHGTLRSWAAVLLTATHERSVP